MIKSLHITSPNSSESFNTEQQDVQQQDPLNEEFDNTNQLSREDGNSGQITNTESETGQTISSSNLEETGSSFDDSTSSESSCTSQTVSISGGLFQPSELKINVGDTVIWTNDDSHIHSITSTEDIPVFDSGIIEPDNKFENTFNTLGEFEYFCILHPFKKGTVKVS